MSQNRWYPSAEQLKDPAALERAFRQLLKDHYSLQDKFHQLHSDMQKGKESPAPAGSPAGTHILGLPVLPADPQALADGATLKYNKKSGTFVFS